MSTLTEDFKRPYKDAVNILKNRIILKFIIRILKNTKNCRNNKLKILKIKFMYNTKSNIHAQKKPLENEIH